jgi:S-formylglutathione hydrolase
MELKNAHACFGGAQRYYEHHSSEIGLAMKFSVYLPPKAVMGEKVPALLYLAGLTCTEETFMIKAGAQRLASELNIALICPDTSPRGAGLAGEADSWDFGVGAGFYLDATTRPWALHWRMESYILNDLLPLVGSKLPVDLQRLGIFGHSMGGHGALTLALRHPGRFKSVSAFAPIANPINCPWGHKAFSGYLGDDKAEWARHDASELMSAQTAALPRRHPHRPGPGRQVPDRKAIAARSLRSRLRPGRSAAHAAPACGLRPWLLFHPELCRRPSAPPCAATGRLILRAWPGRWRCWPSVRPQARP